MKASTYAAVGHGLLLLAISSGAAAIVLAVWQACLPRLEILTRWSFLGNL